MARAIPASAQPTTEPTAKQNQRRQTRNALLTILLAGMALSSGGLGGDIAKLFRSIIRLTIVGGIIGTLFLVIKYVLENLTNLETGITVLDTLIQGGLTLVVGYLLLTDVIETITPKAKQFLGF